MSIARTIIDRLLTDNHRVTYAELNSAAMALETAATSAIFWCNVSEGERLRDKLMDASKELREMWLTNSGTAARRNP